MKEKVKEKTEGMNERNKAQKMQERKDKSKNLKKAKIKK